LPTFKCLPENRGQHNATIHLLPQESNVIAAVRRAYEKVKAGELAEFPTIEWYIHTQADPTLQDDRRRHNAAFFVEWVPYTVKGREPGKRKNPATFSTFSTLLKSLLRIQRQRCGCFRPDPAKNRTIFRDFRRSYPSCRQTVLLDPEDGRYATPIAWIVLMQRGLPPGRGRSWDAPDTTPPCASSAI
jgi:hypothetical protein